MASSEIVRWIATFLVAPLCWALCLVLSIFLHEVALKLWCAGDAISGSCPNAWFWQFFFGISILCSVIGAVLTVWAPYALAPNSRVAVLWTAFGVGWFVLAHLVGFMWSLPAAALGFAIAFVLSRREVARERSNHALNTDAVRPQRAG
jgi:hypothetical protein